MLSKHPADPSKPSVGRINIDFIPPPHTAESIMRCISKIEELNISKNSQLFNSISSEFPTGNGHISILSDNCPGSTPEDPLVFVIEPVMVLPSPAPVALSTPDPTFNKRLRVIKEQGESVCKSQLIMLTQFSVSDSRNTHWLTTTVGEILHTTNAHPQPQPWIRPEGCKFDSFDGVV